jgi:hypothetical protein
LRTVRETALEEVGMAKKESKEKGGLCCPHCADSKYPCVTMEKQMRKGTEESVKEEDNKKA